MKSFKHLTTSEAVRHSLFEEEVEMVEYAVDSSIAVQSVAGTNTPVHNSVWPLRPHSTCRGLFGWRVKYRPT